MAAEGDHRHCKVCGRVCATGSQTCGKACAQVRENQARTRRNYTLLLYGSIALLLIVFLAHFV